MRERGLEPPRPKAVTSPSSWRVYHSATRANHKFYTTPEGFSIWLSRFILSVSKMAKKVLHSRAQYNQASIYVATGAAIALGTYLILTAVAGDKLDLNLVPAGRSQYFKAGEQISFGVTNNGQKEAALAEGSAWQVINEEGTTVYRSIDDSASKVPINESIYWSWDQTNRSGKQVGVGQYDIEVNYLDSGEEKIKSMSVKIVEDNLPWYKKLFD